jgi:hypothetical protein
MSSDAQDLRAEVKAAWAAMDAPPPEDMRIMDWEYGEEAVRAFVGVRPDDVDISSVGFRTATPLLELPGSAAAAYLGPYLVSLVRGFQIQQVVGSPADVKTRSYTIAALTSPTFWTDIASPHLDDACVAALGKVVRFVIENGEAFLLDEEETRALERLARSVDRRLNPSGGR